MLCSAVPGAATSKTIAAHIINLNRECLVYSCILHCTYTAHVQSKHRCFTCKCCSASDGSPLDHPAATAAASEAGHCSTLPLPCLLHCSTHHSTILISSPLIPHTSQMSQGTRSGPAGGGQLLKCCGLTRLQGTGALQGISSSTL